MLKRALTETSVPNKTRRRLLLAPIPKKNNQSWISRLSFRALQVINFLVVPVALINVLRWWNSYDDTEAANILAKKGQIFLWTLGSSFVISVASSFSEKAKKTCTILAWMVAMLSSLTQYFSRMAYCVDTGCDYSEGITVSNNQFIEVLAFGTPFVFLTLHGILRYYYKTPGSNDPTVLLALSWNAMEIPRSMLDKTIIFQRSPYTQPPMLSVAGAASLLPVIRLVAKKCSCTKKSVAITQNVEVKESKLCCISTSTFKKIGRFVVSGKFIIMPMYVGSTVVTMAFNLFSDSISIDSTDIMWAGALIGIAPTVIIGGILWIDRHWIHPNQGSIVPQAESQQKLEVAGDIKLDVTSINRSPNTRTTSNSLVIYSNSKDSPTSTPSSRAHSQSFSDSPPTPSVILQYSPDSPPRLNKTPSPTRSGEKADGSPKGSISDTAIVSFEDSAASADLTKKPNALKPAIGLSDSKFAMFVSRSTIQEIGQSSTSACAVISSGSVNTAISPADDSFQTLGDDGAVDVSQSREKPSRSCGESFCSCLNIFNPCAWYRFFCPSSANLSTANRAQPAKLPVEMRAALISSSASLNDPNAVTFAMGAS